MSENNIYKPISTNPHIKDIDELSLSSGKSININLIKKVLKK